MELGLSFDSSSQLGFDGLRVVENESAGRVTVPALESAELRFMKCPVKELWSYHRYIERVSPFVTQQKWGV